MFCFCIWTFHLRFLSKLLKCHYYIYKKKQKNKAFKNPGPRPVCAGEITSGFREKRLAQSHTKLELHCQSPPSAGVNNSTSGNRTETKNSSLGSEEEGKRVGVDAPVGLARLFHFSGHEARIAEGTVNTVVRAERMAVAHLQSDWRPLPLGLTPTEDRVLPAEAPSCLVVSSPGPGSGVLCPGRPELLLSTPAQPGKAEVLESPALTLFPPPLNVLSSPGFLIPHCAPAGTHHTLGEAWLPRA